MDFRKQGFKEAGELQRGYELFLVGGGGGGMTPNLQFLLSSALGHSNTSVHS